MSPSTRRQAGLLAAFVAVICAAKPLASWRLQSQPDARAGAQSLPATPALSPRNASYSIDVRLDPTARTLTGREVLTWRNITGNPAPELQFHLYYNAWRNSRSTWLTERAAVTGRRILERGQKDWGWIDVTAIRLLGAGSSPPIDLTQSHRFVAPDDGNNDDRTVMVVPLPTPVAPGRTINLEIEWTSQIPRPYDRTGGIGRFFFIAQWFPKIGVLEQSGWNTHQFHAATEFFADFGVYDVRMTVPTGWILGATGVERERRDNSDGTTTHRYYQEDVHDFAWTTSPEYLERRERFEATGLPPVDMRLLLQPEHANQADRHFAAARATLEHYGKWFGPYPYGHITIVDPPWRSAAGGMEYPTLVTAGTDWLASEGVTTLEDTVAHEVGHQFWYGIVANNEFEDAWMDEGLNTFATARVLELAYAPNHHQEWFFGGFIPWPFPDIPYSRAVQGNRLPSFRSAAKADVLTKPAYSLPLANGGLLSYNKTALWLHTLERYLGWPTLQKVLATYFERWKFRHPTPRDFFVIVNEVSGRDMTWFFDQVYRSSNAFDYGVERLSSWPEALDGFVETNGRLTYAPHNDGGGVHTELIVRRYGEAVFPVEVLIVFDNGEQVRERWDGRDRWRRFVYERAARARYAQVDPDRVLLLDVDYTNNSRSLQARTESAAWKWSLQWLAWLEDLMLTYAFFI